MIKRYFLSLLLLLLLCTNVGAERKKVGVVLAGGGAKGVSHIGVLRVLEEAGIPIDYISGTSMGAIIGGLYSIGYTVDELDSLVRAQDWPALLGNKTERSNKFARVKEASDKYILTLPLTNDRKLKIPSGVMNGQSVYNLLTELTIGYHDSIDFRKLPIPFSCIAYDAVTGKEVVLESGNLAQAIRASMSIPGAFTPVNTNDMVLVDGGMINNLPADIVKQMGAEVIIGVDLASELKTAEELQSVTDLADQITNFLARDKYEKNLELIDLYIHPNLKPYTAASFTKGAIDTLVARGESKAREQWFEINELKNKIGIAEPEMRVNQTDIHDKKDSVCIGEINFQGLHEKHLKYIRRLIGIKENNKLSVNALHTAVEKIQGTGAFSDINYKLNKRDSIYDLTFFLNEKSNNSINFGFRFDTEEMAAILLNATFSSDNLRGSSFEVTGRLSRNPYVKAQYSYGNTLLGNFALSYMFKYNDLDVNKRGKKQSNITYGLHKIDLQVATWSTRNFDFMVGANFEYYDYKSALFAHEENSIAPTPSGFINYYGKVRYETLNKLSYPTSGMLLEIGADITTDNFATYKGHAPFSAFDLNFKYVVPIGKRVVLIPELYGRTLLGRDIAYPYWNFLGGEVEGRYMPQQIPFIGLQETELFGNTVAVVKLEARVALWNNFYVSALGNYAQHSNLIKEFFNWADSCWGAGVKLSYDSPIGPISVLVDGSNLSGKAGFYFSLGRYF